MNNEEKKAIAWLSALDIKSEYEASSKEIILNLIEKQQKEIEDKKEEIYSIAKTNYILGQTDERNEWYKKINELIKEKSYPDTYNFKTISVKDLKKLLGKEE